ncbi:MAG TPA: hypothetical protein VI757_01805 [Bacteroidia bacterium]|nr:hypothetical protein [Bacteroidia bacterium]
MLKKNLQNYFSVLTWKRSELTFFPAAAYGFFTPSNGKMKILLSTKNNTAVTVMNTCLPLPDAMRIGRRAYETEAVTYIMKKKIYVTGISTYVTKANTYVMDTNTYVTEAVTYIMKIKTYVTDISTYVMQAKTYVTDTKTYVTEAVPALSGAGTYGTEPKTICSIHNS